MPGTFHPARRRLVRAYLRLQTSASAKPYLHHERRGANEYGFQKKQIQSQIALSALRLLNIMSPRRSQSLSKEKAYSTNTVSPKLREMEALLPKYRFVDQSPLARRD
jgi:hypothetical protein